MREEIKDFFFFSFPLSYFHFIWTKDSLIHAMKLKFDLKKVKIIIFQNYVFLLTNKKYEFKLPSFFPSSKEKVGWKKYFPIPFL